MTTALDVLRGIGSDHLGAATAAVLVCPNEHSLGRVVVDKGRVVWIAQLSAQRTGHSASGRGGRVGGAVMVLLEPEQVEMLAVVGVEDYLPAACPCGPKAVPVSAALEVAAKPPRRARGVPRVVVAA